MPDGHCNPEIYITREEHHEACENRMKWANAVVETSKDDRKRLWDETEKIDREVQALAGLVTKFQWWFIAILVSILISSYAMPKLTANGTHAALEKMNNKIDILSDKQSSLSTILDEVRNDQQRRQRMEKK